MALERGAIFIIRTSTCSCAGTGAGSATRASGLVVLPGSGAGMPRRIFCRCKQRAACTSCTNLSPHCHLNTAYAVQSLCVP